MEFIEQIGMCRANMLEGEVKQRVAARRRKDARLMGKTKDKNEEYAKALQQYYNILEGGTMPNEDGEKKPKVAFDELNLTLAKLGKMRTQDN